MSVETNDLTENCEGEYRYTVFCTTCAKQIVDIDNAVLNQKTALETANQSQCAKDGHIVSVNMRTLEQIESMRKAKRRLGLTVEAQETLWERRN